MLNVKKFTFNVFQENTYILHCSETKEAIIIDPGCSNKHEIKVLTSFIESEKLKVSGLYNTHAHIDHILGSAEMEFQFELPTHLHTLEEANVRMAAIFAPNYGYADFQPPNPVYDLDTLQNIKVGQYELQLLFVPGHSSGSVAFYAQSEGFVIAGDALFNGSIGRTDLPGGSFEVLESSIKSQLYQLPEGTIVYCGHGPETTIGREKATNPFVRG